MKYLVLLFSTFILLLASSSTSLAQWTIRGKVTDQKSGLAQVFISSENRATQSDKLGNYELSVEKVPCKITFRYIGYSDTTITIQPKPRETSITLNVVMREKDEVLPPLVISAFQKPDTVWGDTQLNVADFCFFQNKTLLLTYEKESRFKRQEHSKTSLFSGARLVLLDDKGKESHRALVPGLAQSFYLDGIGQTFLQCLDHIYFVSLDEMGLSLQEIPQQQFAQNIQPVVDTLHRHVLYSDEVQGIPEFDYQAMNLSDSANAVIHHIIDEQQMEMFRSQWKYLAPWDKVQAADIANELGIDKKVVAAYMSGFQNSNYYYPIYAPLLVSNDTLLLFDHPHNELLRFSAQGHRIDSTQIDYHLPQRPEKWSGKIIQDDITKDVYTYTRRNQFVILKRINKATGKVDHSLQLYYPYVEQVRVHNDEVYYVYRPFESSQKRFLYKEKR